MPHAAARIAGSAADQAGLAGLSRDPDGRVALGDVIVAIDGAPVTGQNDLFKAIDKHQVGDKIEVTVKRGASERRVEVVLQAIPQ